MSSTYTFRLLNGNVIVDTSGSRPWSCLHSEYVLEATFEVSETDSNLTDFFHLLFYLYVCFATPDNLIPIFCL